MASVVYRVQIGLLAIPAVMSACARVEPQVDYQRAARLISGRTGSREVFDPQAEETVATRVELLIADGLTLDEAVQVATLNNRDFQVLLAEIGASRADVVQSTLLTNPTLALGLQFPEGGGRTDLTFSFAQQVADLWQIPVRKRIAEADLEQTILRVGQRAVELAAEVRVQCYSLLAVRRAAEFVEENARLAQRVVGVAETQFKAGEVSEFDVDLTRSSLLDAEQELIAVRGELRQAEVSLAQVLGLTRWEEAWQLVDPLPVSCPPPGEDADLVEQALDARFDAQVALLRAQRAEDALRLQCRRFLPDVQLGFAFERGEQRALPGRKLGADTARTSIAAGKLTAPDIQSRGQRRLEKSQIIDAKLGPTLALALPLWDQNQAQIAKARTRVIQARSEYEGTLDAVSADVQRAAASALTASEALRFQQETGLPQAEATLSGAERRYQAGEESVLVVIGAQEGLIKRRRAYVSALRDCAVAMARLEGALGGRTTAAAGGEEGQ